MLGVWVRSDPVLLGDTVIGWVLRFSDLTEPAGLRRLPDREVQRLWGSVERFLAQGEGGDGFGVFIAAVREATGAAFAAWYSDDGAHGRWLATAGTLPRPVSLKRVLAALSALCRHDRPSVPFEWEVGREEGHPFALYVFPLAGERQYSCLVAGGLPEGVTPTVAVAMTMASRVGDLLLALERYRRGFSDALRISSQRQVLAEWERQREQIAAGLEELEQALARQRSGQALMVAKRIRDDLLRPPTLRRVAHGGSGGIGILTTRERQILELVSRGQTDRAIAEALGLSVHTVKNHIRNILRKLEVHNRTEAVATLLASR